VTRSRLAACAALLCAATVAVPAFAGTVTTCAPGGTLENAGNGWLLSRPAFTAGPAAVTMVASPAYDPNLIYASNGVQVVRSRDAGCGWKPVYSARTSVAGATPAITALAVPSSANSSAYLYVGVTSTLGPVSAPSIDVSDRYGDRWSSASTGLPQLGRVREIAASPQVQLVAFAVVDSTLPDAVSQAGLYSTSDGGATWNQRTATGAAFRPRQLLVDPVRQAALYGVDGGRAVRSLDNAETFAPTPGDPGAVTALTGAPGAGAVRLAGALADGSGVTRSDDGGRTWRRLKTPQAPLSVAVAPLQDVVVASDASDVWLLTGGRTITLAPADAGPPTALSVSAPTSLGYAVTGIAAGGVLRANIGVGTTKPILPPVTGRLRPVLLLPARPVGQFPSLLLPQTLSVALPAGQSTVVPYRLLLPRTPTPADVMFLVDSTSSYQPVIDGLRQGIAQIVNALNGAGLDVRFGIGNFEDYPEPYGVATDSNVPYRLDRKIGPSDAVFAQAIADIVAHDGTPDGGQSALTAIYQSLTGAGEVIRGHRVIAPRLDAGFRPQATKFVMTSTDTEPHYRGERIQKFNGDTISQPGPSYAQVIHELVARGVRSVGIPAYYDGGPTAVEPLRRLAAASGALAPPGGVDCDGNGTIDLATADPLVCVLGNGDATSTAGPASGIAAAVVGLVAGIKDMKPVTLAVTQGADRARIVTRQVHTVDLHADNELAYGIRLTCPRAAARTYPIALRSATASRLLAGGTISLACAGLPGAPRPDPPAPDPPLPPRAAAGGGAAEVKINLNTNSHTQPNPNSQSHMQPVVNANVGLAYNVEQQVQLALAEDNGARGAVEQLAMSDHRATEPGALYGLAAATMTATASGVALRRRTRTAYAASYAGTRPRR
jgi:hypothetical protein